MDGTLFIFDVQASLFMSGTSGTMSRLDEVYKGTVSEEGCGFPGRESPHSAYNHFTNLSVHDCFQDAKRVRYLQVNESHQSYENRVTQVVRASRFWPPVEARTSSLCTTALEGPVAGRITWTVSGGRKQKLHCVPHNPTTDLINLPAGHHVDEHERIVKSE